MKETPPMDLSDDQKSSFGVYLQAQRQAQDISLQVLSIYLRISLDMLTAIENEDYSKLPEPVFSKSFLRSFAEAVEADPDFVVQNYLEGLAAFEKAAKAESRMAKREENQLLGQRVGLALGALLVVIVLIVLLTRGGEDAGNEGDMAQPGSVIEAIAPDAFGLQGLDQIPGLATGDGAANIIDLPPGDGPTCSTAPLPEESSAPAKKPVALWLKVDALEETWLKIIIDNQKPNEYTLQAGDHLSLGATSRFNLLIGNAAGVKLSVNDKVVPVPGERGQTVTIDIP